MAQRREKLFAPVSANAFSKPISSLMNSSGLVMRIVGRFRSHLRTLASFESLRLWASFATAVVMVRTALLSSSGREAVGAPPAGAALPPPEASCLPLSKSSGRARCLALACSKCNGSRPVSLVTGCAKVSLCLSLPVITLLPVRTLWLRRSCRCRSRSFTIPAARGADPEPSGCMPRTGTVDGCDSPSLAVARCERSRASRRRCSRAACSCINRQASSCRSSSCSVSVRGCAGTWSGKAPSSSS